MCDYWEWIEAVSKGNLEECKGNAPTKTQYKENRELVSNVFVKALCVAMSGNHDNVVDWLLQHRTSLCDYALLDIFEVNAIHQYELSAIDFVVRNGNTELLKTIMRGDQRMSYAIGRAYGKAGLTVPLGQKAQQIAFIEAVRHGHKDTAMAIMPTYCTDSMLFCAYKDQPELLKLFIEKTSGAQREDWWHGKILTLLYLAAKGGIQGCSQLALEYLGTHVDVNALHFQERFSALHVAAYYGHEDVVGLLLQQSSINLQVKDVLGRTPLHYASGRGHLQVVLQLLHKLGPLDDNLCDDNGMSPLHLAVCAGHTQVIRELLNRAGSSTNYTRRKAQLYTFRNLEFLFNFQDPISGNHRCLEAPELYVTPNLIDSVFWCPGAFTALHFASALSHPEVLQQLITFYCQKELDDVLLLKDSMGFTAYEWAQSRDLGEVFLSCMEASKGKEFARQFTKDDTIPTILNLLKAIHQFEKMKIEMKWCMDTCQALIEHNMDVAKGLVYQAECQKLSIACFGQLISRALTLHIFPILDYLEPADAAYDLSKKCMMDSISMKNIEGLMIDLCKVAEFTSDVVDRWLHQVIIFGFEDLAYYLIVQKKVNCNTPIDIKCLMGPRVEWKDLPSNGVLSGFKLAVTLKQPRMQRWMAERDDVKRGLYEDRQIYVDYANTILVGAVLIAGVAYQGWLQPPSGFDEDGYALVDRHSSPLQAFWWFNNISFFLSVATVIAAGVGAMPSSGNEQLVDAVNRVHSAVSVASIFFPLSMICIMAAFAVAGLTILPHHRHPYQLIMKVTVSCGAVLCSLILLWFTKRLFDLNPKYKSPQLIWKKFKKGTSLLIGFCTTTIFLCCIILPYGLIVGFLHLVQILTRPCPSLYQPSSMEYSIGNITKFVGRIAEFLGHHLCMGDFIDCMAHFYRLCT